MMVALLVGNLAMFAIMFFAIKYIVKVVTVPKYILVMMCVVGAYTINYGIMFDVWTLLIFGFLAGLYKRSELRWHRLLSDLFLENLLKYIL